MKRQLGEVLPCTIPLHRLVLSTELYRSCGELSGRQTDRQTFELCHLDSHIVEYQGARCKRACGRQTTLPVCRVGGIRDVCDDLGAGKENNKENNEEMDSLPSPWVTYINTIA